MKREEIRRENARALAASAGGIAEFGRKTGMDTSQVSQIIGKTPKKNIGNIIAKRIENAFQLQEGALDVPVAGIENETVPEMAAFGGAKRITVGRPSLDVIPVKMVNLRVQAGYPHFDADEIYDDHTTLDLPRQWVEENQLIPNCLLAIKVRGASMEPMLYEDETIVINIADTKPVTNQIFAVNYNGSALVKQMVYKNKDWWLYSFNHDDEYKPVKCTSGDCIVIGKMVYQPGRSLIGKL